MDKKKRVVLARKLLKPLVFNYLCLLLCSKFNLANEWRINAESLINKGVKTVVYRFRIHLCSPRHDFYARNCR